jgi:hypothetical protein
MLKRREKEHTLITAGILKTWRPENTHDMFTRLFWDFWEIRGESRVKIFEQRDAWCLGEHIYSEARD